jgi:general secretion pathway protein A
MLGAYAEGASVVDTRIMRKAAAEVLPEAQREGTLQRPWRQGLALTLLLGVGLAAGLWYSTSPLRAPTAASAVNDTVAAPAPSSSPTATPGQARPEPGPTPRAQAVTEQPPVRAPSAPEPVTVEAGASVTASTAEFPQPGAAKQMPSAEPSLAERLDEAGAGAGASAWPGLYRLWGYASAAATDEQACAQAPAAGLSCLSGSGNWGLLRRLDRPAVLLLHTESGRLLPVLLQQADADRARLEIDGEVMWVSQAELEQRWYGPYRLLWKKPPSANALLQPGMRGSDVRWLREQLARLNGQDDAAGDPALYDASLAAAVRMLQREHGLIADGIAGAHTLITLNNLLADPDIPHLAGSATGSPE